MIDRRTFLARSSVATALAAAGMSGGANAAPLVLPATITPRVDVVEVDVQEVESFVGCWMSYDHVNHLMICNEVEIWATRDACGMTARPIPSQDPDRRGERVEFADPTIAWAFTCLMRLMRSQGERTD